MKKKVFDDVERFAYTMSITQAGIIATIHHNQELPQGMIDIMPFGITEIEELLAKGVVDAFKKGDEWYYKLTDVGNRLFSCVKDHAGRIARCS